MNDHLHRLIYKMEEAAQDLLTFSSGLVPLEIEWDMGTDQFYITLERSNFERLTHPDSCKVICHIDDEHHLPGVDYELQWGMTNLLNFRTYLTKEEYEALERDQDDIPF